MYDLDQEHMTFIMDAGMYYNKVMSFSLISVPATTYQRLVNIMFKDQIGRTMEVHVDDLLVKSKYATDPVKHL